MPPAAAAPHEQANGHANHSADAAQLGVSLASLPSELLHHIFLRCTPSDLGALGQVSRALHDHLADAPQLWKEVYLQWWDDVPRTATMLRDGVVQAKCPQTRTLRSSGDSVPYGLFETDIDERLSRLLRRNDGASTSSSLNAYDFAEQVRRRTWASKQVKVALQSRPINAYANYNELMRALLAIARTRTPRHKQISTSSSTTGSAEQTSKSADYLTELLNTHTEQPATADGAKRITPAFHQLVYPRTDVQSLHAWQADVLLERDKRLGDASTAVPESATTLLTGGGKANGATTAAAQSSDKRMRSSSSSSGSPVKAAKRTRATTGEEAAAEASSSSGVRRRSARVQLHRYPNNLHHLLHDQHSKNVITLDDGSGVVALESMELLDPELAAELHVLHGMRAGNPSGAADNDEMPGNDAIYAADARNGAAANDDADDDADDHDDDDDFDDLDPDVDDVAHIAGFFGFAEMDNHSSQGAELYVAFEELRGRAREIVYDNARFGPENSYGPLHAWRERFEPLDGPHVLLDNEANGSAAVDFDDEDEPLDEQDLRVIARVLERQSAHPQDWSDAGSDGEFDEEEEDDDDEEAADSDDDDDVSDGRNPAMTEEMRDALQDGTPPFPTHGDDRMLEDEDDDDDFDWEGDEIEEDALTERHLFGELRRLAISLSRGILPYFESAQLKALSTGASAKGNHLPAKVSPAKGKGKGKRGKKGVPTKAAAAAAAAAARPIAPTRVQDVFRTDKRVDWIVVEAIMMVMYGNIRHAALTHEWGRSFQLPGTRRSLTGRDPYARSLNGVEVASKDPVDDHRRAVRHRRGYDAYQAWRDMIALPCGWSHSRGQRDARLDKDAASEEDAAAAASSTEQPVGRKKPYDWAGVESVWIGTYAFLDWNHWAYYNGRDPVMRGLSDPEDMTRARGPMPSTYATSTPNLAHESEAVGDCLQLRMELLPLEEQKPFNKTDRIVSFLEGHDEAFVDDDEDDATASGGGSTHKRSTCQEQQAAEQYPPLRFRGHTRTYMHDRPPIPRGELYGIVRPIYATTADGVTPSDGPRAIVAVHWDITHRYDGEDAWSLSGVQAGPPGTRAPIYGIWGAAQRQDHTSPCGPFAYYMVDERPWKSLEEQHHRQMGGGRGAAAQR